jgi:hypothetical protein
MAPQALSNERSRNNTLAILGGMLLVPPLLIWGLWIQTFSANPSASPGQKVEIFLKIFPSFMQSGGTISLVVLVSSVAAIVVSVLSLKRTSTGFKVLSVIAVAVGSLVTLVQLFTML